MVILDDLALVGEAEGHRQLDLILGLVLPVTAPALSLPEHGQGQGVLPRQLGHIVLDPVLVLKIRGLEFSVLLILKAEYHPRVHHGLTLHDVLEVGGGHGDVGKYLQIGLPPDGGARLFPPVGGLYLQATHVLPLLEVQGVLLTVPPDGDVHILAGVLGGAGTQAVQAQGVLVVVPVGAVLAAGVQFAEHQLPVELALFLVPVHRTAPALVLHLKGAVLKPGDSDERAVTLPRLIDGVGQDLKYGVLAAVQPIGAKDHPRALAHPVGPLQG